MESIINVNLVDDDKVTRKYLAAILRQAQGINFENEYSSAEELLNEKRHLTGVVLVDVQLPGISGIDLVKLLEVKNHKIRPLFISSSQIGSVICRAILAGGCGFLVKPIDDRQLIFSIYDVAHGGCPMSKETMQAFIENLRSETKVEPSQGSIEPSHSSLTGMEKSVFELVIKGFSSKEIANLLSIALATVNTHIQHIFKKFKVESRSKLLALVFGNGVVCKNRDKGN